MEHTLTPSGGRDVQPTLPHRVTPEHRATPLGPLSPCPMTTGSASRVSHRKTPPAQGGGCRQGHARGRPPPRRRAARGAGRGASGSAGLSDGWRAPPRARASGKGGRGGREGPAPGGCPRSYRGTVRRVNTWSSRPAATVRSREARARLGSASREGTRQQAPGTRSASACISWCPLPPRAPGPGLPRPRHCRTPAGRAPPRGLPAAPHARPQV